MLIRHFINNILHKSNVSTDNSYVHNCTASDSINYNMQLACLQIIHTKMSINESVNNVQQGDLHACQAAATL